MRPLSPKALTLLFTLSFTVALAQFQAHNVSGETQDDVWMVDASIGYVSGNGFIYKTTDGGQTWTLLPNFVGGFFGDKLFTWLNGHHLYFTDALHGVSAGYNLFLNGEEIIRTSDGGTTWTVVHAYNPQPAGAQELFKNSLTFVEGVTGNILITGGYEGRILRSTDAGATWNVMTTNTTQDILDGSFMNSTEGIAVGENIALWTSDGGVTWQPKAQPGVSFTHVQMIGSAAYATDVFNRVLRSGDQGDTWVEIFQAPTYLFDMGASSPSGPLYISGANLLYRMTGAEVFEVMQISSTLVANASAIFVRQSNDLYLATREGRFWSNNNTTLTFNRQNGFYSGKSEPCPGVPTQFTNIGDPSHSFAWYVNGSPVANTFNFQYTFTVGGQSEVKLTDVTRQETVTHLYKVVEPPVMNQTATFQANGEVPKDTIEFNAQAPMTLYAGNVTTNAHYTLLRNGVQLGDGIATDNYLPFSIPVAPVPGAYTYELSGLFTNACGTATMQDQFTMIVIGEPRHPENLTLKHLVGNQVLVQWDENSIQATQYIIERRLEGTATWQIVGTVAAGDDFTDAAGLVAAKHYFYRVAGSNAVGVGRYSEIKGISIFDHVIYVNKEATGKNYGTSWIDAFTSYSDALDNDVSDLEIWVAKGVYLSRPIIGLGAELPHVNAKGMYGGFVGNETLREQRNSFVNTTTLSADLGVPGELGDNASGLLDIQPGATVDGFTLKDAMWLAVESAGLLNHCIVENTSTAVNMTGTSEVSNTILRNNDFGVSRSAHQPVFNCVFYNNTWSYVSPPDNVNDTENIYNCQFNSSYYIGGFTADYSDNNNIASGLVQLELVEGGIVPRYRQYPMEYMAGDDGIAGNDDDIFYWPEPDFIDNAVPLPFEITSNSLSGFFFSDLIGNARTAPMDKGPIEYQPDPNPLPPTPTIANIGPTSVELQWPAITDPDVSMIWLTVTAIYPGQPDNKHLVKINKNQTSYVVGDLERNSEYAFSLRLERNRKGSFPGNTVQTFTTKETPVIPNFDDLTVGFSYNQYPYSLGTTGGQIVSYNVADNSVAVFNGNVLKILKTGTTTMTATASETDKFFGLNLTKTITVTKGDQFLYSIEDKTWQVPLEGMTLGKPGVSAQELPVSYSSSNPAVATVSGSLITAVGSGTTIISATQAGNENFNPVSGQFNLTINVVKQNQSLTYSPVITKSIVDADFAPTITVNSGLPLSLSSSDPTIASVSGNTIQIINKGQVTISISQPGNTFYFPAAGNITLNIVEAKQDQSLTNTDAVNKTYGDSSFDLAVATTSGLPLLYGSLNNLIASVDGPRVTIHKAGVVDIYVTQPGSSLYNPTSGTVRLNIAKAPQTIPVINFSPDLRFGMNPIALHEKSSGGVSLTYTSTDQSTFKVLNYTGIIKSAGHVTLTVSAEETENYLSESDVYEFDIKKTSQEFTGLEAVVKKFGDPAFDLNVVNQSGLSFTITSSNDRVVRLNGGRVEIVGAGLADIQIANDGNDSYEAANRIKSVKIERADQVISFSTISDHIVGETIGLVTSSTSGNKVLFVLSSDRAELIGEHQLLFMKPGKLTVSAYTARTDNHNESLLVSQTICVNAAAPEVTFKVETGALVSNAPAGNQWYLNDNIIPGAVLPTLALRTVGSYKVRATVEGCIGVFSKTVSITVTGVKSDPLTPIPTLYPNPASDFVFVTGLKQGDVVRLTNSLGTQMLVNKASDGDHVRFDLQNLSPGVYFVIIDGSNRVLKFINR